jgi:nucleoside-diphosphate-sugar epimerase
MSELLIVGYGQLGENIAELAPHWPLSGRVLGLSRSPRRASLTADVTHKETLLLAREACPRPLAIVYCASPRSQNYDDIYVRGVENVITVWPEARLLLVSSTAVYGTTSLTTLDESSPIEPKTQTELAIAEGEKRVLAARADNWVVRPSGIYGPGRTSLLVRLLESPLSAEESARISNRIHQRDLARVILTLLGRPETSGVYLASDLGPASLGEVQTFLQAHPLAAPFLTTCAPRIPPRERTRPAYSRRLIPARLTALDFRFDYPSYREGYDAILQSAVGINKLRP